MCVQKAIALAFCLFSMPLAIQALAQSKLPVPDELTGHWKGEGRIIVTWSQQRQMPFDLIIDSQGNVSGKIGDARLINGRLTRRSRLMTRLGNHSYLIRGRLDGPLIAAEKISRDSFWLMLDPQDPRLTGGMNTTGWKTGGKEKMILSVTGIVLNRVTG
jgi:hypothetical protein